MTARKANVLGVLACVALLAYAYYAQFVMHLEPCPLCIFQRVGLFAVGVVFALAALHDPAGWRPAICIFRPSRPEAYRLAAHRSLSCSRYFR